MIPAMSMPEQINWVDIFVFQIRFLRPDLPRWSVKLCVNLQRNEDKFSNRLDFCPSVSTFTQRMNNKHIDLKY